MLYTGRSAVFLSSGSRRLLHRLRASTGALERLTETLRTLLRHLEDEGSVAAPAERAADPTRLLTVEDVASLLATSPKGVYAKVARGQLPGVMRVGRRVLFRPRPLRQWLDGEERQGRSRR